MLVRMRNTVFLFNTAVEHAASCLCRRISFIPRLKRSEGSTRRNVWCRVRIRTSWMSSVQVATKSQRCLVMHRLWFSALAVPLSCANPLGARLAFQKAAPSGGNKIDQMALKMGLGV